MKFIVKFKWVIAAFILALTVILMLTSPNLTKLASEKGQSQLPDDAVSSRASQILKNAGEDSNTISMVIKLDNALDKDSEKQIQKIIDKTEKIKGVKDVTTPLTDDQDVRNQLMSKDKKTVLVPVTVSGSDEKVEKIANQIYDSVPKDTTAYVTGASLINQDFAHSSEEGLKKTEFITIF